MAVARGQTAASGSIVLCAGAGLVSVPVDADGQPTGPAHICPDCALGLFAATIPPAVTPAAPLAVSAPSFPVRTAQGHGLVPQTVRPRAPPCA
jgi:hypothetical protein